MKQHITIDQLIELGTNGVLTVANHSLIDTVWSDFETIEKVESAIDTYQEKGWKHSTLIDTAKQCNVTNFIAMLQYNGRVLLHNMDKNDGTTWRVNVTRDTAIDSFTSDELCDALWEAVRKYIF